MKLGVKACTVYSCTLKDTCDRRLGRDPCQPLPQFLHGGDPAAQHLVAFILLLSGVVWKHSEALCIQTTPEGNRLNQDEGYEVPGCWIATMKKLEGGAGRSHTLTSSHVYP